MEIGWHHPIDDSDQWDGFNEPGIEHFRSNPLLHLAREIIQNAIDARDHSKVRVSFNVSEIETSSIPNINELRANFHLCLEAAENESEKAKRFFRSAIATLEKPRIKILKAIDSNTHGMRGPSKNGTPFYAFMKAKGQSKKDGETASGSYGIGKFAPYAASELRTVFVSTIFQGENGDYHQLCQGKSILMSHDVDNTRKQGIGFWGIKEKCQPVYDCSSVPDWIARSTSVDSFKENKGTTITILGFAEVKDWKDLLAISVVENFFAAISADELSVTIDDDLLLDATTISDVLNDNDKLRLLDDHRLKGEPDQFINTLYYYAALQSSPEVIEEFTQDQYLGHCRLSLIVSDGLPKKVCAVRNGMFISDTINRLRSFSDYKDFVAVFKCENPSGNQLLRQMEPPKHDDFEPNLLPKEDQKKGKKALLSIAKWIREMLKRHARDATSDVTPLDELKDYFGDENGDSGSSGEEANPMGKILIRAKPSKSPAFKTKVTSPEDNDYGDGAEGGQGGGGSDGRGGGGGTGGKGQAPGGSGKGSEQMKPVEIKNIRAIVSGKNNRVISLTPTTSGKLSITVYEAGADSDYPAAIIGTDVGTLKDGAVVADATEGERLTFNIVINDEFEGAMKVIANEI